MPPSARKAFGASRAGSEACFASPPRRTPPFGARRCSRTATATSLPESIRAPAKRWCGASRLLLADLPEGREQDFALLEDAVLVVVPRRSVPGEHGVGLGELAGDAREDV